MTVAEYREVERLSNSMLSWIKTGPKYFLKMVELGYDNEEKQSYLTFGTIVHMFLLQKDEFNKQYYVLKYYPPSNNLQNKLCEAVIASGVNDIDNWDKIYRAVYSIKNKSLNSIKKDVSELYSKYNGYTAEAIDNKGKKPISEEDYINLLDIERNVNDHIGAYKALNNNYYAFDPDIEIHNEYPILYKYRGIEMKALLDRFIFDLKGLELQIIDIKTSSVRSERTNFKDSFLHSIDIFDYDRQLYSYKAAAKWWLMDKGYEPADFHITVKLVAIKSNYDHEVRVFVLDDSYLERGKDKFDALINDFMFYEDVGYDYNKEYYDNGGDELIKLDDETN